MDIPLAKREIKLVLDMLDKENIKDEFIELGCGEGFNLEFFAKRGMKGTGVELSKPAIAIARKKRLKGIRLLNKDIFKVRFSNQKLIFLSNVLEHINDDVKLLKRINSFMSKGSYLFLVVPANSKAYSFADRNAGHYRRYDRKEITIKLKKAGFSIERFLSVGFPVCNLYTWVFNKYQDLFKRNIEFSQEKTYSSGIQHSESYFPFPFNFLARIFFPLLSLLIRLDWFFLDTDLGNNYVIMARK